MGTTFTWGDRLAILFVFGCHLGDLIGRTSVILWK